MEFNLDDNPQPLFIPARKEAFVRATNGKHLNVWLCTGKVRASELFQQEVAKYDPFVNHFGEETAVMVFTGYGEPPHNPYMD